MFGFRVDGVPRQLNYLFDEGQSIGEDGKLSHGPNAVISMVHDGLTVTGFGEDSCSLHADNCAGKVLLIRYAQFLCNKYAVLKVYRKQRMLKIYSAFQIGSIFAVKCDFCHMASMLFIA